MTQYKTAREIMQAMNDGDIPRKHLGPKNFHILKQELFSHKNQFKPQTFTEKESTDWFNTLCDMLEEITQLPNSEQKQLFKEVDKMLDPTS